MAIQTHKKISFVVPIFNEAQNIVDFNKSLIEVISPNYSNFEIIYVDDGSTDTTNKIVTDLASKNRDIKLISLSRNFGKENALTAGINYATGDAVMMLDGDGQHPVELIPEFVRLWLAGNKVVVGVRTTNSKEGTVKKLGSYLFYKSFNNMSGKKLVPGTTDFRIIDKVVQEAFLELNDVDRVTRGLIDWLGFKTSYIKFRAKARVHGEAGYSFNKLVKLAMNSYVGFSTTPLYFFGYLGIIISSLSFILGLAVFIEQLLLGDPLNWKFTGTAMLGILIIFLVGILLMAQGILSIYISMINNQSRGRALYIVDHENSIGLDKK
jgi:dolichol-phosphate mannosyltransferase